MLFIPRLVKVEETLQKGGTLKAVIVEEVAVLKITVNATRLRSCAPSFVNVSLAKIMKIHTSVRL